MTAKEVSALAKPAGDWSNQEELQGLLQPFLLHFRQLALLCTPFVFRALAWQWRGHYPIH